MTTETQPDADPARSLADALPLVVFEAAPNGSLTYLSPRWYEYSGLEAGGDVGGGWIDRIHQDDYVAGRDAWAASLRDGSAFEAQCRLRGADGVYRWFLVRARPRLDAAGAVASWAGTCTDVDALKRSVAAAVDRGVRERTAELRRSNDDLERFAAIASHDLQEPLRKVQSFSDRLSARCASMLDDRGREYLDRIASSVERMHGLIHDLLALARISAPGGGRPAVDLGAIVDGVVADLADAVERSGGVVRVGPLPTIHADPAQMRQLFQNLIANALKFRRPGEAPVVRVSAREVAGGDAPASCELVVSDDGIGFDLQHLDRIFRPFQRLHGRSDYEGTGLGLAICRRVVEVHSGTITAESAPGGGATFRVVLPTGGPSAGDVADY